MIFENNVWIFKTDYPSFLYCRDILIDLISRFPLNQQEALKLINTRWALIEINEGDITYHELPKFWSSDMYWGRDSLWWKQGKERKNYNLPELKPYRPDNETKYELWEPLNSSLNDSDYIDDYVFVDYGEINELIDNQLIIGQYYKTWEVTSKNYREALKLLHEYKGWGKYFELY
ncbi:hypothetical protein [Paenibacillus gorillae]|uniref:hypothetical protein n=1 Tax=Paenibacillus gorillae TaxID=1243662 RepID=UPI0005AB74B2|nr:hypothetical protein [Paenibacillus gorillae]